MKKLQIKTILFFAAWICGATFLTGQTAIRQSTVIDNGPADTLGVLTLLRNSNNALIVAGNKAINATQCNFQTLSYDSLGTQTWAQTFNANMQKAYTTAATRDHNDNIIVVGCTYVNSTHLQDLTVLKYSPSGTLLWQQYYDGGGNDVASDVIIDGSNNIYVTGSKAGTGINTSDYVTLKLNSSGTVQWVSIYDYSGIIDNPMSISIDGSYLTVSGTSGSGFTNFDIATVRYTTSSGSQQSVYRQSSNATAQNFQSFMIKDNSGNIYYTGRMWNGSNYDILLTKLGPALNALWSVHYDGFGGDDAGSKLALDNSSNSIVLTGYVTKSGGLHQTMVLKYDTSGTLSYKYPSNINQLPGNSEGLGLRVAANGDIYIGGNSIIAGNQDAFLLKLNRKCEAVYYDAFNNSGTNEDQFFDLITDNGTILLTVRSDVSGQYRNILVKYIERDITPSFVGSHPAYVAGQQIVSFNPAVLNMATINDRKFTFGKLSDFVHDSVCNRISTKLSTERQSFKAGDFLARKIFLTMTDKDSLSVTRIGDTIKVPKFYSALLVDFPALNAPLTLQNISDKLNAIKPAIFYSEFNYGMKLCSHPGDAASNDLHWNQQANLRHFPNTDIADINVDTCWAVAHGNPSVKVGVFDSGIQNTHFDLDSIPINGYNFVNPTLSGLNDDANGHGTQMFGIIAATKNNIYAVAGIAGRDDSTHTQGVSLANCRVLGYDSNGYDSLVTTATAAFAMHHAVRGDSTGFAINIANHSYAYEGNSGDSLYKNKTFQDQLIFACRNGVAITGAKTSFGNLATAAYPADWNPEINTCVGGSGKNGHRSRSGGGSLANANGTTNFGYHLDFLAPASSAIIVSTDIGTSNEDVANPSLGSAACAHVSGAYALMMSYFNPPIALWGHLLHEDCENILKRTCTDLFDTLGLIYNESHGYDIYSGYGRINLSRAIREINKFHYRFRHINTAHANSSSFVNGLFSSNINIQWPAINGLPAGNYVTDVYQIVTTLNYTLNPNETIIDAWPMYKECFGWANDITNLSVDKPYYAAINYVTTTQAQLTTYAFYNHGNSTWYPANPNNNHAIRSAITLYTYDLNNTGVGIKESLSPNTSFRIRPNPNSGQFNITFGSEEETDLKYNITDLMGREVKSGNYRSVYGENNIPVNINELPHGLYILSVSDRKKTIYNQKIIKHQ